MRNAGIVCLMASTLAASPAGRAQSSPITERQPYARSVLCPTSMIYPSGSRI